MNNDYHIVKTGDILIDKGSPLVLISGPCVIEDYETTFEIASFLNTLPGEIVLMGGLLFSI